MSMWIKPVYARQVDKIGFMGSQPAYIFSLSIFKDFMEFQICVSVCRKHCNAHSRTCADEILMPVAKFFLIIMMIIYFNNRVPWINWNRYRVAYYLVVLSRKKEKLLTQKDDANCQKIDDKQKQSNNLLTPRARRNSIEPNYHEKNPTQSGYLRSRRR